MRVRFLLGTICFLFMWRLCWNSVWNSLLFSPRSKAKYQTWMIDWIEISAGAISLEEHVRDTHKGKGKGHLLRWPPSPDNIAITVYVSIFWFSVFPHMRYYCNCILHVFVKFSPYCIQCAQYPSCSSNSLYTYYDTVSGVENEPTPDTNPSPPKVLDKVKICDWNQNLFSSKPQIVTYKGTGTLYFNL